MKALVKTEPGPGLHLIDVPAPVPGPQDVLIRVTRTGICGTCGGDGKLAETLSQQGIGAS